MVKKGSKNITPKKKAPNVIPPQSITGFPPKVPSSKSNMAALSNLAEGGKRAR